MWELSTPLIVANRSQQGDEVYGSYPLVLQFKHPDCGSLRQSGPRQDPRLLRQAALEALTRSARTDSPRRTGRKQFSGDDRRRRTAGGGGGAWGGEEGRLFLGFRVD
ncbi:hypothetical protein F511_25299 [Dorcoceras hygrometricum]|uniref:Uncharacterized protein n=1 Tax=Dorcoceras hygrometricum TaxID=472368 RepID=A0A2Z7CX66_9LAMI|nr:hypothetical protein F511_25299 [Dorcoceras hygrometricum]